ncbi:5-bromo-4-chloroindolyl phosphate hydrolysis family protein [Agrilactobacillus yilanensis]|uniref:5-bromo-4-chloroindolyl phosphate hydrolysis family protein n=1 Tax=Agrilactobacillus yilanensis TaxID=2485997 RepID=A0ABW4J6T1_9LACO|nr:5-bromo-4-chloroindolyl phosphate hydrolysis family protein [Agrilactobacillus yilanensis]
MDKNLKRVMHICAGFFLITLAFSMISDVSGGVSHILAMVGTLSLSVFLITLPFHILQKHRQSRSPKKEAVDVDKLDRKMLAHYQKAGLSDSDVVFFRKTMNEAETQIRQLSKNIEDTPKLKAIDLNIDFVKVSKSMFAAIVKEPQRLSEASAGDFLYRHLPTLVSLTDRYIEISHHEVKTTDTWEVLAKSLDVIKSLGNQVREDYSLFVADDLDEMDQEMSAATDSLSNAQKDAIKMNEALAKVNASYEKNKEQH